MEKAIDLQELGAELKIYGEIDDPAMRWFNPSIAFHKGKLKIAIRSCNFMVERHGKWSFRDGSAYSRTDVIYGDLDPDTLQVSNLEKLTLSKDAPIQAQTAGVEDVRLFERKDGMHAIGFESDRLSRSLHNASAKLAEYLIKGKELKYLRTLEKPKSEGVEKNWSPTDIKSDDFDFTYSPTQVWKDGKVTGLEYKGDVHGGTQLLKQKDGTCLSIVHEKKLDTTLVRNPRLGNNIYDKFIYYHYLAKHNKDGMIIEISKPFTFGTLERIEFAGGMVEHNGDFIISFGIRDCKYALCKISRDKLMELF